jgi:hypothetical protein
LFLDIEERLWHEEAGEGEIVWGKKTMMTV